MILKNFFLVMGSSTFPEKGCLKIIQSGGCKILPGRKGMTGSRAKDWPGRRDLLLRLLQGGKGSGKNIIYMISKLQN